MTTMTIHNLDDELNARLRIRAAQHGHSMEEEAQSILHTALARSVGDNFGAALYADIRVLVVPYGRIELELPPRELQHYPPDFSGPEFDA